jgi:hypothetical protein
LTGSGVSVAVSSPTASRSSSNRSILLGPSFSDWREAHNSPGSTATGTRWAVAEGELGGPRTTDTFVLVANTSPFQGEVKATVLFEDGTAPVEKTFTVPAKSRFNIAPPSSLWGNVRHARRELGTTPIRRGRRAMLERQRCRLAAGANARRRGCKARVGGGRAATCQRSTG